MDFVLIHNEIMYSGGYMILQGSNKKIHNLYIVYLLLEKNANITKVWILNAQSCVYI